VTDPVPAPLAIASFKLQLLERRVRIVPEHDALGAPFAAPGVDLVGAEADAAIAEAAPLLAWLRAREPVVVRTISLDVRRARLLATLDERPRPRVVRIDRAVDAGACDELLERARPLLARLGAIARVKLAARV
jgi:hypothetical protein